MATIAEQTGSTTFTLNEHLFTTFAEGDILEFTPVNPKTSRVNSQKAVTIANRSDGDVHDVKMRVQKLGEDDIFLNTAMNQADPVVFNGSSKTNFTRDGVAGVSSWILENGSLTDRPTEVINVQDGSAMMEYTIQFRNGQRNI